jgi:hypothetical protein
LGTPHFGGDLLISHSFHCSLEVWAIIFDTKHMFTSSQLNGHVIENYLTVILAARADFILYLDVVQEHVAASASGDLNFCVGFLDLAGFEAGTHE